MNRFWKTILALVAPIGFLRLYGGGGGDGGAGQMRADEQERQRKVQMSVDAINRKFGVGGAGGVAPDREQFRVKSPIGGFPVMQQPAGDDIGRVWVEQGDSGGYWMTTGGGAAGAPQPLYDDAAYNKAMAEWQGQQGEAERNKAAREAMYADIAGAVRDTAMRDLDRQYSQASRRNTFGLARSGLLGGSVDAESGGELATLYGEGKLKATQAGRQAGSDLRVSDEKTRQNLISLAQSGLDTGTASSLAAGQMGAAAELAKSQAAGASVGRLFDDLSQAYVTNQVMKARYPNGMPQQQSSPYSYGGFGTNRYTGLSQ